MRNTRSSAVSSTALSAWPVSAICRTCAQAPGTGRRARARDPIGLRGIAHAAWIPLNSAARGRIGGGDHGAAEADVAVVQHQRLSRRDRALRPVEAHLQCRRRRLDLAGLVGLAIAGCARAAEARARRRPAIQCAVSDRSRCEYSQGLSPPWATYSTLLATSLPTTYHGAARAAHAADTQAVALAQGVDRTRPGARRARVRRGADLAGARRQVAGEELAEIAFADEADAGGILFRVRSAGGFARDARAPRSSAGRRAETGSPPAAPGPAGAGSSSGPCRVHGAHRRSGRRHASTRA